MKLRLKSILFLIFISSFALKNDSIYAQTTKLTDKISFSANNITVAEALESLSRITGTNFSYNPDQIPSSKIIKVDINNRALSEVIGAILNSADFGYRQMGNQIIIYKNKSVNEEDSKAIVSEENPPDSESLKEQNKGIQLVKDTIYLTKNIHDTLVVNDTIIKIDTIIEKIETPVSSTDIFHVNLGQELSPELKFDAGILFTYYFPHSNFNASGEFSNKINQYNNSYTNNSFAGSAGIEVKANYSNWSFGSGVFLTLLSQKLDYLYLDQKGGFFRKDTLDPYFTILDGDTTWYYIVDSTYIPIDNKLYNYKINNHFNYLEIPLFIQYNIPYSNLLFYGRVGVIPGIITSYYGKQILPDKEGIIDMKDIKTKPVVLSYLITAGAAIPINYKFVFNTSVQYRNHFGSIYKDFPIKTKFSAIGISVGITYKFY